MILNLFRKKDGVHEVNQYEVMNNKLINSFNSVKSDTSKIFQWLEFFYKKVMDQDNVIMALQQQIELSKNAIPQQVEISKEQIKEAVDEYYKKQALLDKIEHLESINKQIVNQLKYVDSRVDLVLGSQAHSQPQSQAFSQSQLDSQEQKIANFVEAIQERIKKLEQNLGQDKKTNFKEKLVQKITKNSKDYIKNFIFSLIQKYEDVSAQKLREIVVEEQGFCSKSSFYRLLEELEEDERIGIIRSGKEKKYMFKPLKKAH